MYTENLASYFYILNGVASLIGAIYFLIKEFNFLSISLGFFFLTLAWYQFGWGIHSMLFFTGVPIYSSLWFTLNLPFTIVNIFFIIGVVYLWRK